MALGIIEFSFRRVSEGPEFSKRQKKQAEATKKTSGRDKKKNKNKVTTKTSTKATTKTNCFFGPFTIVLFLLPGYVAFLSIWLCTCKEPHRRLYNVLLEASLYGWALNYLNICKICSIESDLNQASLWSNVGALYCIAFHGNGRVGLHLGVSEQRYARTRLLAAIGRLGLFLDLYRSICIGALL